MMALAQVLAQAVVPVAQTSEPPRQRTADRASSCPCSCHVDGDDDGCLEPNHGAAAIAIAVGIGTTHGIGVLSSEVAVPSPQPAAAAAPAGGGGGGAPRRRDCGWRRDAVPAAAMVGVFVLGAAILSTGASLSMASLSSFWLATLGALLLCGVCLGVGCTVERRRGGRLLTETLDAFQNSIPRRRRP